MRNALIVIGKNVTHSSIIRVLAAYAVGCFVVLQLLDIVLEPLGISVTTIRWVVLLMIAFAPILVVAVAWNSHRKIPDSADAGVNHDQETVFRIAHADGYAELDTAQRQIRFSGKPADVQPKVFDLIEYLLRARDRVVSKDELFDKIWPAVVVTEASLTQSIKRARDLFRRNGFDTEVIRTIARKGYQFDGPVDVNNPATVGNRNAWLDIVLPTAAASLVAIALGLFVWNSNAEQAHRPLTSDAANSLAVLPFTNLTPDQGFTYFSDGLTETLTSTLTTVSSLRIIARGSAFSFRDTRSDYAAMGNELNVAHVVEGSVQRNNDELRISARLIRAQDGQQIWSEIYSRDFDDVFALQDEISQAIVEQMAALLSTPLTLADSGTSEAGRKINAEAYRLVLLGRSFGQDSSTSGIWEAEKAFRAALRIEPEYPEAMLGLASAISLLATTGELPRESTFNEALALIRRALEQNPNYAEAHVQLAEIQHRHFWDFEDAAKSFATALRLKPGSAETRSALGRFLSKSGNFARSIAEAEVALDLDPKSARAASSLATRSIRARQLDQARSVIDALRSIYPEDANLPWLETNWHIRNGSYRDALKWVALEELDYLRLSLSAITLYHLGRTEQAREVLDELIESDPDGSAFQIAEAYAQWGQADTAFDWLERAFSQGDPGLAELYSSFNLESLYVDARFAALAQRIGLPPLDDT